MGTSLPAIPGAELAGTSLRHMDPPQRGRSGMAAEGLSSVALIGEGSADRQIDRYRVF